MRFGTLGAFFALTFGLGWGLPSIGVNITVFVYVSNRSPIMSLHVRSAAGGAAAPEARREPPFPDAAAATD